MTKLKGKAKADFLKKMKKGREEAAKKKKSKIKKTKSKRTVNRIKPSKTRRDRGGSASDIDRRLLLAIKDPNVKEIIIRK